nr:unnamed protein product [Digitaria exilis]
MHEATVSQPTNGKVYLAVADVKQLGLGAPMVASMLREDLVQEYWENERKKIKNSLDECLQNCKVQAKLRIIDKHDVAPALLEQIKERKITTLVLGAKNRYVTS